MYRATFLWREQKVNRIGRRIQWPRRPLKGEAQKLIVCGASASRDWEYARFRAIADEVGALRWRISRTR
ncbi:MAG: hypothetical protein IPI05_05010 [Flavobacteriales bacterium]|nr:hypothetical protein [Flavobacteriales bacterium]